MEAGCLPVFFLILKWKCHKIIKEINNKADIAGEFAEHHIEKYHNYNWKIQDINRRHASTTGFIKRNVEYSNMGESFHICYSIQETYGTLINLILKPRSQKKPSY